MIGYPAFGYAATRDIMMALHQDCTLGQWKLRRDNLNWCRMNTKPGEPGAARTGVPSRAQNSDRFGELRSYSPSAEIEVGHELLSGPMIIDRLSNA